MDKQYPSHEFPLKAVEHYDRLPEELRPVAQWYMAQPRPQVTDKAMRKLLSRLVEEKGDLVRSPVQMRQSLATVLRITRWQLVLLGPWFWITSVLLLLLGGVVTPLLARDAAITVVVYLLPLMAVLSTVYALRRISSGMRDIEVSTPTGFVEMMTGVVLALICFDGLLGLLATLAITLTRWASFGIVLTSWLGPLLLLVAVSFPVALRWGTMPAMLIGGGPWLIAIGLTALLPDVLPLQLLISPQGVSLTYHLIATILGGVILLLLLLRGSTWQRFLVQV